MDKHLHIVTHDIPWPVAHGGLTDLYYKIVSLHKLGVKIHLHCFSSKVRTEAELDKYCVEVYYYKRKTGLAGASLRYPYIVFSRRSDRLIRQLNRDKFPVLLEGIHCTWLLHTGELTDRKVFVRLHNAEYKYYYRLGRLESNPLKKAYFYHESKLLQPYERSVADKATFLCVSRKDANLYTKELGADKVHFVPVFIPHDTVTTHAGQGNYCLYHGNLSVNENEAAAMWLIKEVFNKTDIPLVVAGWEPSADLHEAADLASNTVLIADPWEDSMQQLIREAQINVLPSFNETGVKLKLLNALFNGRHCLVNNAAIDGAVVNELCHTAETADEFREKMIELFTKPFTVSDIQDRQSIMQGVYDNEKNALHLMTLIW